MLTSSDFGCAREGGPPRLHGGGASRPRYTAISSFPISSWSIFCTLLLAT